MGYNYRSRAKKRVGIYKITNLINGKIYIGQAGKKEQGIFERWNDHQELGQQGMFSSGSDAHMYHAMRKYNITNFTWQVIAECNADELDELEKKFIWEYEDKVGRDNMYNTIFFEAERKSREKEVV